MDRMAELDERSDAIWQAAVARGYKVDFPAVMAAKRTNPRDNMWQQFIGAMRHGRVYPRININGTVTGRMTMSGPNLQGLSPDYRRVLLADPGEVLISCDLSHVDPSMASALSGDPEMQAAMLPGRDPYLELASKIAGEVVSSKDDPRRQTAKSSLMAVMFGMQAPGLTKKLNSERPEGRPEYTEGDAKAIQRQLWEAWPGFKAWVDRTLKVEHPITWGGKVLPKPSGNHMPVAYTVQGSSAVYFKAAASRAEKAFTAAGMPNALWLPIHDELVVSVPEARAEESRELLEQAMCSEAHGLPIFGAAEILGQRFRKPE